MVELSQPLLITRLGIGYLPEPLSRVRCISKANPVSRSGLAHAQSQKRGHWQDSRIQCIAGIDERLLGPLGQRRPPTNGMLCRDIRAGGIDGEIGDEPFDREGEEGFRVGRRGQGGGIVNYHAGGGVELGLDRVKYGGDRVVVGKVGLEGEEAPFGGLGAGTLSRRDGDLVAVACQLLGDGGTDSGTGSENQCNRMCGYHFWGWEGGMYMY